MKAVALIHRRAVLAPDAFVGVVAWSWSVPDTFTAPASLWHVLAAKRGDLLTALDGAGPASIREAARRVKHDVKAVHGDVTALFNAGLLNRVDDGRIEFPYEAVKAEFMLNNFAINPTRLLPAPPPRYPAAAGSPTGASGRR